MFLMTSHDECYITMTYSIADYAVGLLERERD